MDLSCPSAEGHVTIIVCVLVGIFLALIIISCCVRRQKLKGSWPSSSWLSFPFRWTSNLLSKTLGRKPKEHDDNRGGSELDNLAPWEDDRSEEQHVSHESIEFRGFGDDGHRVYGGIRELRLHVAVGLRPKESLSFKTMRRGTPYHPQLTAVATSNHRSWEAQAMQHLLPIVRLVHS